MDQQLGWLMQMCRATHPLQAHKMNDRAMMQLDLGRRLPSTGQGRACLLLLILAINQRMANQPSDHKCINQDGPFHDSTQAFTAYGPPWHSRPPGRAHMCDVYPARLSGSSRWAHLCHKSSAALRDFRKGPHVQHTSSGAPSNLLILISP